MAVETFTWRIQRGEEGQHRSTVRVAQFGDGYRQTSGDGMNSVRQTWAITCTGRKDEVNAIRAFLTRHLGKSFAWRNPHGEIGLYQASEWNSRAVGGGLFVLTSSFEQAFHP